MGKIQDTLSYLLFGPDPERIREQIDPTQITSSPTTEDWYWGRTATGTQEDYYWRRLSDNWYQKDVIPSTYLEIHNQCYEAYNANPLAQAIVEMYTNFCVGQGITVTARSRQTQRIIDRFWHDPDNHMDARCYQLSTELSLYGEQFIRFFVNRYDGSVKIAQIDPSMIDQVETDPENIEKILRVHRRPIGSSATLEGTLAITEPNAQAEGEWLAVPDEVMQFTINKVSNAKRGHSDLATLLPWLRRYKDWLTDRVRINKYKSTFLWDVTLNGADKKTIQNKKMEYAYPPEPGSVIIHNEAEVWSAVKPEINALEAEADGRALKLMIAVGAGLPEHYLSDGQNSNRATAAEMGMPTLLRMKRRQKYLQYLLSCILDRVITEAKREGTLSQSADPGYTINLPQIDIDDTQVLATSVQTITSALATAREQKWCSTETAMKIFYQFADMNDEVDIKEEMERVARESAQPPRDPTSGK